MKKQFGKIVALVLVVAIFNSSSFVFAEDLVNEATQEERFEQKQEGDLQNPEKEGIIEKTEEIEEITETDEDVEGIDEDTEANIGVVSEMGIGEDVKYFLQYQVHCQKIGWQENKTDGEQAGTTGESKRMEAIAITVNKEFTDPNNPEKTIVEKVPGAIQYQVHCQKYGNMNPVNDGAIAGTSGESKRMEAIQISLTGEVAEKYDVWYQVYNGKFGNMGWAKNGQWAGTNGYSCSIESLTILLKEKGSADAPTQDVRAFISPDCKGNITYVSHVQTYGWLESVADGEMCGTQGQKKRMEALRIYLDDNIQDENGNRINGSIEYQVHCQKYGWMNWTSEGEVAGTSGESKRLEAIRIRLTGDIANSYDVYYRAHSSKWGTLGWAKNGEVAGTEGYSRAIESIEIILVKKSAGDAPIQDARAYLSTELLGNCNFVAYMQGNGQYSGVNNTILGNVGKSETLDAVALQIETGDINGLYSGGISYSVYARNQGWLDAVSNGAVAGIPNQNKPIEAIQITLNGELEKYCDVYYRAYIEEYGWLDWAKNGQSAGSTKIDRKMEALQIKIVYKGASAPGNTSIYYMEKKISNSVSVPAILQNPELPTGCESVALTIALHHYGYNIGKTVIADSYLPYSSNYAIGFSGNPYSYYGAGCFAPAIVTAANKFLNSRNSSYKAKDITGTDFQELYNYIDRGYPVIVWGTMYMKSPVFTGASVSWNGRRYLWYRMEHCMVLYGYDKKSDTVKISDPLQGYVTRSRADFEYLYNITGKNAVVIQ